MGIKLTPFDVSGISSMFKEFEMEVKEDLQKAAADLAAMTKAKVDELASEELKTSLDEFKKHVGWEEISPGIFVVYIDEEALWQEEGIKSGFDMKPGLLKNATKVSKDGHRYRSIPFDHGKVPSKQTPKAQQIVSQIKDFLKKENVPFKKIEKNQDGSPRVGKLHRFDDIDGERPTARSNTGALKGLTIYQTKDAKTGNVRRSIMTFRTVSDGMSSHGKWIHPGYPPKNFLDRAAEWAVKEWEDKILPEIMNKWK